MGGILFSFSTERASCFGVSAFSTFGFSTGCVAAFLVSTTGADLTVEIETTAAGFTGVVFSTGFLVSSLVSITGDVVS